MYKCLEAHIIFSLQKMLAPPRLKIAAIMLLPPVPPPLRGQWHPTGMQLALTNGAAQPALNDI